MKRLPVIVACFAAFLIASCQQQTTQTQPDTKAADESALKAIDAEWSKAAGAKDVDKTVSYYAADATVLPPNGAKITARDGIKKAW